MAGPLDELLAGGPLGALNSSLLAALDHLGGDAFVAALPSVLAKKLALLRAYESTPRPEPPYVRGWEAVEALFSAGSYIDDALHPYSKMGRENKVRAKLILWISTHDEGLRLSMAELKNMGVRDWLACFNRWAWKQGIAKRPKRQGGRRGEGKTERIFSIFQELQNSLDRKPTLSEIARKRFGQEYNAADGKERKRLRDLVRTAVMRGSATKSAKRIKSLARTAT